MSNITNLASSTALTAVEIKISNVSNLVKKSQYNTKISEIENKIIILILLLITIMINILLLKYLIS